MKSALSHITHIPRHPISVLYGTLLLIFAIYGSTTGFLAGAWEAAVVDLSMAVILIVVMFKNICKLERKNTSGWERLLAWGMLISANLMMLWPESSFSGNLLRSVAFVQVLAGFILYFNNWRIMLCCLPATLWCCVFIPFHEEIMLMASYPLRLSATMLAAAALQLCGTGVVYSGSSLQLPGLDIAITDACSGINQLDAFLLIAYIAVKMVHKKEYWQVLHFAFIIPSIIIANSVRIVLTVLLFQIYGEVILEKFWHVTLGYGQILLAMILFVAVGMLFRSKPEMKSREG